MPENNKNSRKFACFGPETIRNLKFSLQYLKMLEEILIGKYLLSSFFPENYNNNSINFERFGPKTRMIWSFLAKFDNFGSKTHWRMFFELLLQQNYKTIQRKFRVLGQKTRIIWKIWENFLNFWMKIPLKNEFQLIFQRNLWIFYSSGR